MNPTCDWSDGLCYMDSHYFFIKTEDGKMKFQSYCVKHAIFFGIPKNPHEVMNGTDWREALKEYWMEMKRTKQILEV